jgi:hypothetical protein
MQHYFREGLPQALREEVLERIAGTMETGVYEHCEEIGWCA